MAKRDQIVAFPPDFARERANLDPGLKALTIVAAHHRIAVDPRSLTHSLNISGRHAAGADIVRAAATIGLKAKLVRQQKIARLKSCPRPVIMRTVDDRYLVLARLQNGQEVVHDPINATVVPAPVDSLAETWSGELILVTRNANLGELTSKFEFKWFVDAVWRYRKPLYHVFLASLFIQIFALGTPLLFQVIVDKVLVHKSMATLYVIATSLLLVAILDTVLQYLRSYTLNHTSSRIDVELGQQAFSHLLKLPLSYFETRPAGWTVSHLREIETIRQFLTGQALTSCIDLLFTLLFIILLFTYSVELTLIVLISIVLYVLLASVVRPVLRVRIKDKFNRGTESQQFLVETVVGAPTIKSAAVEPILQTQWDDKLAAYVRSSFGAVMLGAVGQNGVQFISKVTTAMILLFGAKEVISGSLTVGELVAFNMIANQLTQPILRLSQLWQDFQQVQIGIERLGDILNYPPELHSGMQGRMPRAGIKGAIKFDNVAFRYKLGTPQVLKGINLDIPAGEVIGIVGPSGSGKSTLTKLLQRLYFPEHGRIFVDDTDISEIHPAWLRRQIGVVLQENLLFNRSIHDNIALATPNLPREQVINVAKLAGADEFIRDLPQGYDTKVEERGANLSGGQRQRIAIARALAANPRILIFDEATSALDYESERVIQENMKQIVRGRTVIIVAHRLAAVRDCDRIIALQNGEVTEEGSHDALLQNQGGLYSRLWSLQSAVSKASP